MSLPRRTQGLPSTRRALGAALAAALIVLAAAGPVLAELPPGVDSREVTTYHWDYVRDGGIFRTDGSSPFAEDERYRPELGDRHAVEYREGWRLTFDTAGEQGDVTSAVARLDFIREFLTPGTQVVRIEPRNESTPNNRSYHDIDLEAATELLGPYEQPAFELAFTGGPEGTFQQTGGDRLPTGAVSGAIERGDDGHFYVSVRPLYIRMRIDDPDVFEGWPGVESGWSDREAVDLVGVRTAAFLGRVELEYPDGTSDVLAGWFMRPARLPVGTIVVTETDGYARLVFDDGSIVELGSRSRLVLGARDIGGIELVHGRALIERPVDAAADTPYEMELDHLVASTENSGTWALAKRGSESRIVVVAGDARVDAVSVEASTTLDLSEGVSATIEGLGAIERDAAAETVTAWEALRATATPVRDLGAAITWAARSVGTALAGALGVWAYRAWRRRQYDR